MQVVVFEDEWVARLYPATVGRPAFEVSCGSFRLADLIGRLEAPAQASVRPHLRAMLQADYPELAPRGRPADEPALLVNARLVPSVGAIARLKTFLDAGRPAVVRTEGSVAAALLPVGASIPPLDAENAENAGATPWSTFLDGVGLDRVDVELPLFEYAHDLVRYHPRTLAENLEDRLAGGDYKEIVDGVFAAAGATLGRHVVVETGQGPIVLEEGAKIGPYCYLSGPAHIGAGARVIEHAAIKDAVALGHTTKVGGEVECSTIEPYTNKQHHGFLGHSYLGSWVNLGAGTCNSDLKNTYGPVSMDYANGRVPTGMQFIGCIIGDYAKTAVNTSIFTGKTIGACSMVYGFVTTNVPGFVNYARSFGQVTEAPVEVMIATQARMFKRRHVTQRECDIQLLHDMHTLTGHERQLATEPLSL